MEKWFNVGKIVNTHGIRVKFELFLERTLLKIVIKSAIPLYLFREKIRSR